MRFRRVPKGQEIVGQAVERMVNGRLGVLSRGIVLTGESEEAANWVEEGHFRVFPKDNGCKMDIRYGYNMNIIWYNER